MSVLARVTPLALLAPAFGLLAGCHSAFVQATVINHSHKPIRLFEMDYPSASFGGGELPDGATFHYRFKILGSGPTKLLWTDVAEHDHTVKGPDLRESQEGTLSVTIDPDGAHWDADLHPK